MATPPTFVGEHEVSPDWYDSANGYTNPTWSPGNGNVVVAVANNAEASASTESIAGGLTWTSQQQNNTANNCGQQGWTGVGAGSSITPAITGSATGAGRQKGWTYLEFSGSAGVGASAKTTAASGAPTLNITTQADNSAIVVIVGDWNAIDGTTRTWRTVNGITPTVGNGDETTYNHNATWFTVYVAIYPDAGAAGVKTVGLSAPTGQQYSIIAIEIKGAASAGLDPNQFLQAAQPFPPFAPPWIAPAATPFQLRGDASGQASVALSDSGAGDDSSFTVAAAVSLADSAAGSDAATVTAAVPLADAGAAADSFTLAAAVPLAESAAAADTLSVLVDYGQVAGPLPFPPFAAPFIQPSVVPFQMQGTPSTAVPPISVTSVNFAGTSGSVPLPQGYASTDRFLIVVSHTQDSTGFTYSSEILSAQEIDSDGGDRRISAHLLTPNGTGQTSFTLTIAGTSGVTTVFLANVGSNYAYGATIYHNNNAVGTSPAAVVATPEVYYGFVATGNELVVSAAATNAAAQWTTDPGTVFNTDAVTNAGLIVDMTRAVAGSLTSVTPAFNRGPGTLNQNALAFVLQATPVGAVNLLTNPSFETFTSGLANSWTDEHTTAGAATYSSTTSGVVDGTTAQRMQYTGQAGDAAGNKILEIYQAPIPVTPGQILTFSVWLSGAVNTDAVIGVEAFTAGNAYISETDTGIAPNALTSTPTLYTVTYTVPAGADHVAAYYQIADIGSSTTIDATLDKAELLVTGSVVAVIDPNQAWPQFAPFGAPFIPPRAVPFQLLGDQSSPSSIALTDAGAAGDSSLTVAATVPLTESGAGADTATVAAAASVTEAGAADDSSFAVAAAISLTEAASGAETLSVLVDFGQVAAPLPFPPFTAPFVPPGVRPFQLLGDQSGPASISLTDAGAGDDSALSVAAAVTLAEAGAAADTLTVAVAVPLAEAGAGSDTATVAATVPLTESGAADDEITVNTGTDPNQAGPLIAPMFFNPAAASFQLAGDASGQPQIGLSDTGSGADVVTVAAAASLTDTGAASDTATVAASTPLTDSGAGSDALTNTATVPATDSGSADDSAITVAAAVPLTEAGSAADSLSVVIDYGYTAGPQAFPAFAAPFISPRAVPFQLQGDRSGSTQVSVTDSGAASDAITVTATVTTSESGAASDTLTTTISTPLAEAGSAVETFTVHVTTALAETGAGSDQITVSTGSTVKFPVTGQQSGTALPGITGQVAATRPVTGGT